MNNLAQRTVVGVPGAAFMVWLIFYNQYSFAFLFFLITVLSLHEFYKRSTGDSIHPQKWVGILAGIFSFLVVISLKCDLSFLMTTNSGLLLLIPVIFSVFIIELYRKSAQQIGRAHV